MNLRVLLTATALLLTACSPADEKVKSVKERLEAGEVVEFTKPGYRRPSCNSRQPDWKDIRLSDESERARIVTKTQASALNSGKHSCFRIGSVIDLNSPQKNTNAGQARITKLSIVLVDKLQSRNLKGSYFSKTEDFGQYVERAKARLKPEHEGVVTIVDFQYIPGSAPDEKEIKEKIKRESEGDGFTDTKKDGDFISTCNSPWTELLAPEAFHESLLNGKLRSYFRIGDLNCLAQGQTAEIKAKRTDTSKGLVKIKKVKKFRLKHVSARYFNLGQTEYSVIEAAIKAERPQEWITVMDVEPVVAPASAEGCADPVKPVTIQMKEMSPEVIHKRTYTVHIDGPPCFTRDQYIPVKFVFADSPGKVFGSNAYVRSQVVNGSGADLVLETEGLP